MDMAHTLFDLGLDTVVVPIYNYVQVSHLHSRTPHFSRVVITYFFVFVQTINYTLHARLESILITILMCSNFWPTIPLAAVFVGMEHILFSSPVFWLGLFIIPMAAILFDIAIKVYVFFFQS